MCNHGCYWTFTYIVHGLLQLFNKRTKTPSLASGVKILNAYITKKTKSMRWTHKAKPKKSGNWLSFMSDAEIKQPLSTFPDLEVPTVRLHLCLFLGSWDQRSFLCRNRSLTGTATTRCALDSDGCVREVSRRNANFGVWPCDMPLFFRPPPPPLLVM